MTEQQPLAHYDDADLDYRTYWEQRRYEDQAERIAIRRMLGERRFRHAVDVGGGYGRLSGLFAEYAERVTLVDPSQRQLEFARKLIGDQARIAMRVMDVETLAFADGAADLVAMIRVMHHLPDPTRAYATLSRVLEPGGTALVEVANQAHAVNRLRYWSRGKRVPLAPMDRRSSANRERESIPFVNHHPETVVEGLAAVGLIVERRLSVSNLRSAKLKAVLPLPVMLDIERRIQKPLAPLSFGPSMLLLARKRG